MPETGEDTKSQPEAEKETDEAPEKTESPEKEEEAGKPKRKKQEDVGGTQEDNADEATEAPQKKKAKTGRAAANTYWQEISAESGVSVQSIKKVHNAILKIASRNLLDEDIGSFNLQGIATFTVKEFQFREAYTRVVKGNHVNVSERAPHKKILAKSVMGLTGLSD